MKVIQKIIDREYDDVTTVITKYYSDDWFPVKAAANIQERAGVYMSDHEELGTTEVYYNNWCMIFFENMLVFKHRITRRVK